jgi:hypothetical protein
MKIFYFILIFIILYILPLLYIAYSLLDNGEQKYIKLCWKDFLKAVRWYDLIFWNSLVIIFYLWLGWIGVIIVLFMDYWSLAVSAPMIFPGESFEKPEYHRECSAKIKGCKICKNEYSHEFNEKYQKTLKWYQKII